MLVLSSFAYQSKLELIKLVVCYANKDGGDINSGLQTNEIDEAEV